MYGSDSERRSRAALFKSKGLRREAPPKKQEEGSPNIIGGASGAYSGAKVGAALGAKAAPGLLAVPVVGPALAAAAPVVGGTLGAIGGGLMGGQSKASPTALYKDMEDSDEILSKARSAGASKMLKAGEKMPWWGT